MDWVLCILKTMDTKIKFLKVATCRFFDEPDGSSGCMTCTLRGMVQCNICRKDSHETCMGNYPAVRVGT